MAAISGYMVVHEYISALQSEPEQAATCSLEANNSIELLLAQFTKIVVNSTVLNCLELRHLSSMQYNSTVTL